MLHCSHTSPSALPIKKRKDLLGKRQGKQRVLEDGARLLQDLISSCDGRGCYPVRMFSAKEIEEAIEAYYFRDSSFINYRGTYQDRPIFIKIYETKRKEAFNEIVTITQINHGNVLKLLGCCFETERPILIYELLPYNLSQRLHDGNRACLISWENRLRIAIEIAYAITYLHIGTSRPIVHRHIKSSNILLDEHYKPKVCDFSLSITIPLGETHVKLDHRDGTFACMDPHYATTGTVSEKVDVYGFGMLLFELLSGERLEVLIIMGKDKHKMIQLISDNGLSMDARQVEQSMACLEIAYRCSDPKPDQRPSMKDVTQQLMQIERAGLPPPSSSSSSLLGVQQVGKYKVE